MGYFLIFGSWSGAQVIDAGGVLPCSQTTQKSFGMSKIATNNAWIILPCPPDGLADSPYTTTLPIYRWKDDAASTCNIMGWILSNNDCVSENPKTL